MNPLGGSPFLWRGNTKVAKQAFGGSFGVSQRPRALFSERVNTSRRPRIDAFIKTHPKAAQQRVKRFVYTNASQCSPREHNLWCGFYKNKLLSLTKRRINSGSILPRHRTKNRPAGDIHSQSGALRYAHRRATRKNYWARMTMERLKSGNLTWEFSIFKSTHLSSQSK